MFTGENNLVLNGFELDDIANAGYHIMVRTGFATSLETVNCYPEDWIRIYTEEGYMLFDPVLRWAYEHTGICRWSDISDNDPKGVLKIARTFGLNYGVVTAHTNGGKDHRRTIASFARKIGSSIMRKSSSLRITSSERTRNPPQSSM